MNNGSKGRCVTITPQASNEGITWLNLGAGASFDASGGLKNRKPEEFPPRAWFGARNRATFV